MSKRSDPHTVVLVGFMGSGKTTVGQEVARLLDVRFVDLDAIIAKRAGRSIPEIFAGEGEEGFRRRETQALRMLDATGGCVVATGGGAVTVEENWPLMNALGPVVFLRTSLQTTLERIGQGEGRPLAGGGGRNEKVERLFTHRQALYARADFTVDTDGVPPDRVARLIVDKLQGWSKA